MANPATLAADAKRDVPVAAVARSTMAGVQTELPPPSTRVARMGWLPKKTVSAQTTAAPSLHGTVRTWLSSSDPNGTSSAPLSLH